jgi:hypothetical protein
MDERTCKDNVCDLDREVAGVKDGVWSSTAGAAHRDFTMMCLRAAPIS